MDSSPAFSLSSISSFLFETVNNPYALLATCIVVTLIFVILIVSIWTLYTLASGDVSSKNKAVLITGCDSGFGCALARCLHDKGFLVFAGCLDPDGGGALRLRRLCSDRLHLVCLDVTKEDQVSYALTYVTNHLGNNELWSLVNNAGVGVMSEAELCPMREFERCMQVNALGMVRVTKTFLPLVRRARGRIINVASLAGLWTLPSMSAYSMSKAAAVAFNNGLRREMRKFGVKVICIEPSLYRTAICTEKVITDSNRQFWSEAPDSVKEHYGQEYFDAYLSTAIERVRAASSPHIYQVIDALLDAVLAVEPKNYYIPDTLYTIIASIMVILPYWIQDIVCSQYLNIKTKVAYAAAKKEK